MVAVGIMASFGCGVAIFNLFTLQNFSNRLCEIENKLADNNSSEENGYD